MIHTCNHKSVNLEYILDDEEEIIIRDSKNSQEFKANIKTGAKDIRIGYILMPGVAYAIYVIAFGSLLAQAASSMQLNIPLNTGFIVLLLSLVMLIVIWHKWGLFSKGATIRLNNKEKVCIVCGHNTKSFDDLVDKIKQILSAPFPLSVGKWAGLAQVLATKPRRIRWM